MDKSRGIIPCVSFHMGNVHFMMYFYVSPLIAASCYQLMFAVRYKGLQGTRYSMDLQEAINYASLLV